MVNEDARQAAVDDLPDWVSEVSGDFHVVADLVGAPAEDAYRDPESVLSYLQVYIDGMPMVDFEAGGWITLGTDVVSFPGPCHDGQRGSVWEIHESDI